MEIEVLFALSVFALVMSITPGPNNLMLMSSGTNFGFRRSVPHMMGVTIGFFMMVIFSGVGVFELFEAFPKSQIVFKVLSVSYLSYLSWKIFMSAFQSQGSSSAVGRLQPFNFVQALLFQWVNPKGWVMAMSAVTGYISSNSIYSLVMVAIVFSLVMLPSISLWTYMGLQIQRLLNSAIKRKVFNISVSVLLMLSLYPVVFSEMG
ncbi:MAG: LysE family translocator [Bdellovibrionales bacterium]